MSTFDIKACGSAIAESMVTLSSADKALDTLNVHLASARKAESKWNDLRDAIADGLKKRGIADSSMRQQLSAVKWCYSNAVKVETLNSSRMQAKASKGAVLDLLKGTPKKVAPKKATGAKAKSETLVVHCGQGMAKAMAQQGFLKFLNTLAIGILNDGYPELDEERLDLVNDALVECGFFISDGAEYKVAVIKESDDEA